jgi:ankyrin repeat protein
MGKGMSDIEEWFYHERLHRAAQAGDLPAVRQLVGQCCPVNGFDDIGMTPLHYAVLGEHFAVVDYLLRHGANINANDERVIGNSPLGEAAGTCSLQMARLLVKSGADPTLRGWMQLNALDRAEKRNRSEGIGSVGQAVYVLLCEAAHKGKPRR